METRTHERTMGRFGRGMLAVTLMVGALLWIGSVRNDHRGSATATIERSAPVEAGIHYADADKDTLDLQLD